MTEGQLHEATMQGCSAHVRRCFCVRRAFCHSQNPGGWVGQSCLTEHFHPEGWSSSMTAGSLDPLTGGTFAPSM